MKDYIIYALLTIVALAAVFYIDRAWHRMILRDMIEPGASSIERSGK